MFEEVNREVSFE